MCVCVVQEPQMATTVVSALLLACPLVAGYVCYTVDMLDSILEGVYFCFITMFTIGVCVLYIDAHLAHRFW